MTGEWMERGGLLADQPRHQRIVDLTTLAEAMTRPEKTSRPSRVAFRYRS